MRACGRIAARWMALLLAILMVAYAMAPQSVAAQQEALSGRFQVTWGDPPPGSNLDAVQAIAMIDDQGQWTSVALDEALTRPFGGPLALNRKRVKIVGELMGARHEGMQAAQPRPAIQARSIEVEQPEDAGTAGAEVSSLAVTGGSQPWVTILCRFADSPDVTPHDVSFFNTLMGASYLDRYWRESSYENINLTGSVVVGWYNLPQPRSYYVDDATGVAYLGKLADDCTAVADADVFFPKFAGINLVFNGGLNCCSWGGSTWLSRDGQDKGYAATWIASWGYDSALMAHEMGHGFGLPHSSGPYGQTYDSSWDVMSQRNGTCVSFDPIYRCNPPHTISYHKDKLGWIPPGRKYVPTPGSSQTITIERLGQPASGSNYLMAQIPFGDSTTQFYTVEARRFAGYDTNAPGEAVVIHHVNWGSAQVVDPDGNWDPNDAGAMWTPGETFTDPATGITVSVDAATATGFQVTITTTIITSGTLAVTTTPVRGGIVVDGIHRGTGSWSGTVSTGSHTVSFGTIAGYTTPPPQTVTVNADQTTSVTGMYTAVPTGTLAVTTTPISGDIVVDGIYRGTGSWSGTVLAESHTVSFGTIAGYTTPPPQTVTVNADQTTSVTGMYTAVPTGTL
ncbi:hypothetical protein, partial [Candidatus Methylomirabilis sp.]|uniref:hypothetical protein n=1 Tax=Candidatus Methylomirabilis sp. TaxID=2032687 RepID=UPI002A5EC6EA|nr:hypothetical protein [Candidatus Methylomirabilis sp.]